MWNSRTLIDFCGIQRKYNKHCFICLHCHFCWILLVAPRFYVTDGAENSVAKQQHYARRIHVCIQWNVLFYIARLFVAVWATILDSVISIIYESHFNISLSSQLCKISRASDVLFHERNRSCDFDKIFVSILLLLYSYWLDITMNYLYIWTASCHWFDMSVVLHRENPGFLSRKPGFSRKPWFSEEKTRVFCRKLGFSQKTWVF